jgi:hypothetical protein
MNEAGEAFEAIVGLFVGGLIFLAFSGTLGSTGLVDFGMWGVVFIVVAIVLALVTVAAFVSQFL